MTIAFLFPGQGSQQPEMLHMLPNHPMVAATLDEASTILGRDVRVLDAAAALDTTQATQIALLVAGVATARVLRSKGAEPDIVAGLSVGSFAAAVVAGSLDFRAALLLVALRAELMAHVFSEGYGMGVIVGLHEQHVVNLLELINVSSDPVFLANVNAPQQMVIAGSYKSIKVALARALALGAQKAECLHISVPSHCPLMSSVADQLASAIMQVNIYPPRIPYMSNKHSRIVRTVSAMREDLATNVAHPVRWHDITSVLFEYGARLFIEMPPGCVLTQLTATSLPEARAIALANGHIDAAVTFIQREHERLR